jgi:hypothetical protein
MTVSTVVLDELELDALTELVNIGVSRAAASLFQSERTAASALATDMRASLLSSTINTFTAIPTFSQPMRGPSSLPRQPRTSESLSLTR